MDLLNDVEIHRYNVLEEFYTILPPTMFSIYIKLTGTTRYTLCGKFKHLERIFKHVNQQWCDKFFLEKYISTKVSPQGLRIIKDCSFLNAASKKEWENISEFCTSKWMEILIEYRLPLFDKLKSEAHTIAKGITDHKVTVPLSWLGILHKNTKSDEDFLVKTKLGKFKRDLDDINLDRVFNWKQKSTSTSDHRRTFPPHSLSSSSLPPPVPSHTPRPRPFPLLLSHLPYPPPLMRISITNTTFQRPPSSANRHIGQKPSSNKTNNLLADLNSTIDLPTLGEV